MLVNVHWCLKHTYVGTDCCSKDARTLNNGLSSLFDVALRKELMTLLHSQLGLVVELASCQRKGKEEELSWREVLKPCCRW